MRNALRAFLLLAAIFGLVLMFARDSHAQTVPTLSMQRVSVVATAQGVTFNGSAPASCPRSASATR